MTAIVRESISLSEVHERQAQLLEDPDFEMDFDQLIEVRPGIRLRVATGDLRVLARENPFPDGIRRAIVAPSDVLYGLSRIFEKTVGRRQRTAVFRTLGEACDWLGVPVEAAVDAPASKVG